MEADFDRKLVSYVERHPALYDPAAAGSSDGQVLAAAWAEIATSLGASECVVKARWKALRRGFRKAYRELAALGPACALHPRPCAAFPFFESMLWLAPYVRRKRCSATLKLRKCPVHGYIGEQMWRKKESRPESASSETTALSSSSYFTETSRGRGLEGSGIDGGGGRAPDGATYVRKRRVVNGRAESKQAEPAREGSGDNPNAEQNKRDTRQDEQNHDKDDSSHKQFNLHLSQERKNESTQTEDTLLEEDDEGATKCLASKNAACQGLLNADVNFMLSIISDMQLIPCKKRIKFKREVMQLLEKYALSSS